MDGRGKKRQKNAEKALKWGIAAALVMIIVLQVMLLIVELRVCFAMRTAKTAAFDQSLFYSLLSANSSWSLLTIIDNMI